MKRKPIFVSQTSILEWYKLCLLVWLISEDMLHKWMVTLECKVTFRHSGLFFFQRKFVFEAVWVACSDEWLWVKPIKHLSSFLIKFCLEKLPLFLTPVDSCSHDLGNFTLRACCKTNILRHYSKSLNYVELTIVKEKLIAEVSRKTSSQISSSFLAHSRSKRKNWEAVDQHLI